MTGEPGAVGASATANASVVEDAALPVILDDARVVVVHKPSGMTSEEAGARLGRRLVHRIDRGTSGLLVLADDARTVTRLQRALRDGLVQREYVFVAHGAVQAARLVSTLVRDRGDGLRGSGPGGKPSSAEVAPLHQGNGLTLGHARLITGRTHQLRVQLAEAGHPLLGDSVYVRDHVASGGRVIPSPRLLLHAWRLCFPHPTHHRLVELCCPPGDDFIAAANAALGDALL